MPRLHESMTTWCSMSRKISASYSQGHNPTESTQRKTRTDATKRPTMATIVESEQDKAAAIQLFEPSSLILTLVYLNHLHPSLISPLISQSNTLTKICPSYAGICREKNTKETDDDMQGQKRVNRYRRRHSLTNLQAGAPWFDMHFLSLLLKGKMIMLTLHKTKKDPMPTKTAPKSFKLRPTTS